MRRLVPALLGLALFGGCAPRPVADIVPPGASAAEIALGPAGVPGAPESDAPLPEALLRGMWERRVQGGRVRYSLDRHMIRIAAVEDRTGKEAFFVQGQWSLGGTNVLLCAVTDASFAADSRSIPELDGAGVIRAQLSISPPALTGLPIQVESVPLQLQSTGEKSFSFRLRPAGDRIVIDRFEAEHFTDRTKRLFEGTYVREAAPVAGAR